MTPLRLSLSIAAANVASVNGERAQAYGEVIKALKDLSPSKLHRGEQDVVREACDALFFCERLESDAVAQQALADFHELVDRLVESERLLPETAGHVSAAVESCGPLSPVAV